MVHSTFQNIEFFLYVHISKGKSSTFLLLHPQNEHFLNKIFFLKKSLNGLKKFKQIYLGTCGTSREMCSEIISATKTLSKQFKLNKPLLF